MAYSNEVYGAPWRRPPVFCARTFAIKVAMISATASMTPKVTTY